MWNPVKKKPYGISHHDIRCQQCMPHNAIRTPRGRCSQIPGQPMKNGWEVALGCVWKDLPMYAKWQVYYSRGRFYYATLASLKFEGSGSFLKTQPPTINHTSYRHKPQCSAEQSCKRQDKINTGTASQLYSWLASYVACMRTRLLFRLIPSSTAVRMEEMVSWNEKFPTQSQWPLLLGRQTRMKSSEGLVDT